MVGAEAAVLWTPYGYAGENAGQAEISPKVF